MTVKCLGPNSQKEVVCQFRAKQYTLSELAVEWNVSRRTIVRVLEEAGVDPGVKHRFPKPDSYSLLLSQTAVPVLEDEIAFEDAQPSHTPITTSLNDDLPQKSWIKRFFTSLRSAVGAT